MDKSRCNCTGDGLESQITGDFSDPRYESPRIEGGIHRLIQSGKKNCFCGSSEPEECLIKAFSLPTPRFPFQTLP